MIAVLHAAAYFVPGLAMAVVAFALDRVARGGRRQAPPPIAEPGPPWARRYLRAATVLIGAAALGLAVLGGALARIVLGTWG